MVHKVANENEGGPFSTSISNVIELLEKYALSDDISEMDKNKINKVVGGFKKERSKLGVSPIVEKNIKDGASN